MTQIAGRHQQITGIDAGLEDGDCAAEPVPALWYQDDDEYYSESGFIDRFWLPLSIAVLAGWGSLSFVLINAFGWFVLLAIIGVVAVGVAGSVILVRSGSREQLETATAPRLEQDDEQLRDAA